MANKNIEINVKNSSNTYDVLYPKTIGQNVQMDTGNNLEQAINNIYTDDTFEVGDILCTCKPNVSDKWLLCDGSLSNNVNLGSVLDSFDWNGTWSDTTWQSVLGMTYETYDIKAWNINNNTFITTDTNSDNKRIFMLNESGNWEQFDNGVTYTDSDDFYIFDAGYVSNYQLYCFVMGSNYNRNFRIFYKKMGEPMKKSSASFSYGSSDKAHYGIYFCSDGIYYASNGKSTSTEFWAKITYNTGSDIWSRTMIKQGSGSNVFVLATDTAPRGVIDDKILYTSSNSSGAYLYVYDKNGNSQNSIFIQANNTSNNGLWYLDTSSGLVYYPGYSKYVTVSSGSVISYTNNWGGTTTNWWNYMLKADGVYYGNVSNVFKKGDIRGNPQTVSYSGGYRWLVRRGNRYWNFGQLNNQVRYIDVPQIILPNISSQSTTSQKEKYYIKAEL